MERGVFRGELDQDQHRIFTHIREGRSGREIAALLDLPHTHLEYVVRKTCRQLRAKGRHEAASIIATHQGSKASPAGRSSHFGIRIREMCIGMVQTNSEHRPRSAYVRDVEDAKSSQSGGLGISGELKEFDRISNATEASDQFRRILVMLLLMVSSALTLSALISAMLGFDVLMAS